MKKYCLHFLDSKEKLDLFEYSDDQLIRNTTVAFDDIHQQIESNSEVYFFIPSYLLNSFSISINENETIEQFKARFFSDYDEIIINNVSDNEFFYLDGMSLVFLISKNIFSDLNQKLNSLGCSCIILPEYYLNYLYEPQSVLEINERINIGFSDGTGHSTNYSSIKQYFSILKQENNNIKAKYFNISDPSAIGEVTQNTEFDLIPLEDFHKNLMASKKSEIPNFFRHEYSIKNIFKRFNLSKFEMIFSIGLLSLLFILPNLNVHFLNTYEKQYKSATLSIFQSINPNTRRVINPKIQIDQIIKVIDIKPMNTSINESVLRFINKIDFSSVTSVVINLPESTIQLSIKNLSSIKYNVFLRLINTMDIEIIEENINDYDGLINGTISLNYKNE